MRKIYNIKNIHCADCARSLEEVISGIQKVRFAKINFLTEKFELEIDDSDYDEVFTKIKKIIRDFSKNVELYEAEPVGEESSLKRSNKLKFKLVGVACGNCANKIVDAVGKLKEVDSASFDLPSGELRLSITTENMSELISRIKSLIHTIDPAVKIKQTREKEKNENKIKMLFWVLGLLLAVPVVLASYKLINLPVWGFYLLTVSSALCLGYSTYLTAIRMLFRLNINENLLVSISVVGAMLVGEVVEGLMVVALYTLGKLLEAKAVNKSRKSIQDLMDISPEFAVVIREGSEMKVLPKLVKVGETIIVRAGEKVALDGEVVSGNCNINAQSLTGESKPIFMKPGDEILSGVVVLDGVLEIRVTKALDESTTTKILNLIEEASENKSKTETFISKFSKYYTLIVVISAILVGTITGLVLGDWSTAVYRGLIFLVISCPCAFAISVPLSYFSGIGYASKRGILIKGSNYLDACAKAKVIAFDKTGTLTTGEFSLVRTEVLEDAYSEEEIIEIASVGEQNSIHPIAKTILNLTKSKTLPKPESYHEEAGVGIFFELDGTEYFVGKDDSETAETKVLVKKGNIPIGALYFEDSLKESANAMSGELKALGVKTALLSGDKEIVAEKVAKSLSFDEFHAELLPEDKYNWIAREKSELKSGDRLLYVGDGINDAPSLALADVGISMGLNGSGASIEASDVVLVDDDPKKTAELIKISKFTKRIVLQNIIFAGIIKVSCLVLGALGIANMILAVFADVGVTILAILNSLRALKGKKG